MNAYTTTVRDLANALSGRAPQDVHIVRKSAGRSGLRFVVLVNREYYQCGSAALSALRRTRRTDMNAEIRVVNDFVPRWDTNHDGYRAIFNAALSGICANPNFFGPIMQQSPQSAVDFANEVVLAAVYGAAYIPPHLRKAGAL